MKTEDDRPPCAESANSSGAASSPASVALLPVSVVCFGSAAQPIDRLLVLKSAIAKGVHLAAQLGRIRLKLRGRTPGPADSHAAPTWR